MPEFWSPDISTSLYYILATKTIVNSGPRKDYSRTFRRHGRGFVRTIYGFSTHGIPRGCAIPFHRQPGHRAHRESGEASVSLLAACESSCRPARIREMVQAILAESRFAIGETNHFLSDTLWRRAATTTVAATEALSSGA